MEFTAQREVLLKALQRALGITEKKSTLPMVSAVLIEAEQPSTLRVCATDLEVALVGQYSAEVSAPGKAAVTARQVADIARSLPSEKVVVRSFEHHGVEITGGRADFKLVGMPPDEFPSLPSIEGVSLSTMGVDTFRLLVERTLFSVSSDETRYNLMGVFVQPAVDGKVRFVSSDGHRLSIAERELAEGESLSLSAGVIVPKKGFAEARRLLEGEGGTCEIGLGQKTFVFRYGEATLMMRPLEAKFPDYEAVVPKETKRVARLHRANFMDALRRVAILAGDKANTVRLAFSSTGLELSATTPQLGEAHETLEVDLTGDDLRIGFNARYLLDALQVIPTESVIMELGDHGSPGVLRPEDRQGFLGVVMPIRI
jgi:DNA polymerase-3 subunit beta